MAYKITGNTYAIRNDLKDNGGKWDAAKKEWIISDEAYAKLNARTQTYGMAWSKGWAGCRKEQLSMALDGPNTGVDVVYA